MGVSKGDNPLAKIGVISLRLMAVIIGNSNGAFVLHATVILLPCKSVIMNLQQPY